MAPTAEERWKSAPSARVCVCVYWGNMMWRIRFLLQHHLLEQRPTDHILWTKDMLLSWHFMSFQFLSHNTDDVTVGPRIWNSRQEKKKRKEINSIKENISVCFSWSSQSKYNLLSQTFICNTVWYNRIYSNMLFYVFFRIPHLTLNILLCSLSPS